MKRHVLFIAGIFSLLTISGCKNIDSSEDENTNTGAYICIEAGAERTIKPNFTLEGMSSFSLYGKKTESDEETMFYSSDGSGGFSTYEDLLKGNFAVSTGTWYEFKLTAENGNNHFVGTISNKEIVQGKNTLHFTLSLEEKSSNDGYVNVTFKIPSATAVKAAKAGLYTRDTDEEITGYGYSLEKLSITPSEDSDSATAVYNHYNHWADSGTYRLKAWFYADEACTLLVSTFSELVKIIDSTTSEAERDIRVNEVYTITLNDEGTYKNSYTPKTLFTRYDNLVELPSTDQMKKSGYTFLGWYTSADGSGQPVTEISGSQAENVVLYAKWYEGCAVSASTYKNADFASSEYGDAYTILLLGEWTDEEFSAFCSKLKDAGISSERSVTLDMSKITGVTSICDSAFYGLSSLKKIMIPDSVTSIGKSAFYNCTSLSEITIPEGVTSIGDSAFYGCTSLVKITIPEGVTSIGDSAFSGCTSLAKITIPGSVTSIGSSAFEGCTSLSEITIPGSVPYINDYVFSGCSSLTAITIPDSVMLIGGHAFSGCTSLSEITIPDSVTSISGYAGYAFYGCTSLSEITIPEGVKDIGDYAFSDCSKLTEITIPASVTNIGKQAFEACTSLRNVTICGNTFTDYDAHVFSGCSSLTNITFKAGVTTISSYLFRKCSTVTTIHIPASVTDIGDYAFEGCTSLTEITVPDSVTSIKYGVFYGCTSLAEITIPDSVTSIGNYAFYGCTSLAEITIPSSVSRIGRYAFENSGIETITFEDTTSIWYRSSNIDYTEGEYLGKMTS